MKDSLLLEIHSHTREYSECSHIPALTLVGKARRVERAGSSVLDRMLSRPRLMGRMGSLVLADQFVVSEFHHHAFSAPITPSMGEEAVA